MKTSSKTSRRVCLACTSVLYTIAPAGPASITSKAQTAGQIEFGRPAVVSVSFDQPTKDTSTYQYIGSSGNTRPFIWMNTFPSQGRQSNLVTMWNTGAAGVPTGIDTRRLRVLRMQVTLCTFPSGPRARYDATPDLWQNTLWAGGDIIVYDFFGGNIPVGIESIPAEPRYTSQGTGEDGNQPIEIYGARFNNGWTAESWVESGAGTPSFQNGLYNAEPIDFDDQGNERSVLFSMGETAVEFVEDDYIADDNQTYFTYYPTGNFLSDPVDGFNPNSFALGEAYTIPDGTPGHSIGGAGQTPIAQDTEIPPGYRFRFDINVENEAIQNYLRDQFANGWLTLIASQLALGDIGLNGAYSYWLTKEGSATLPGFFDLDPTTLDFDYIYFPPGDFNANGIIDPLDRQAAVWALTDPAGFEQANPLLDASTLTDMDGDGYTDLADITAVLSTVFGQ